MYDVTYTKDEAKKEGKYLITFSSEAGFDGDTSWEVYTDESGATPKIKSSKSFTSVGVYDMMIDFLYGDDAEVDGELYEPGSSEEAFAEAPFNTAENNVRTLTVDYAGTKKEIKTIGDYRFEPWTDSTKGTFTLKDENKTYSWMDLNLDTDDWYAANRLINPDSGDAGGYGAPTATLTWAAKNNKVVVESSSSLEFSGYIISVVKGTKNSSSGKKKTVSAKKNHKYKVTGLKKGKKYTVWVKGYVIDSAGKKIYGSWNKADTFKVK